MFDLLLFMPDSLLKALTVVVGWFHPDVAHGVFWGSMLVTFVGSVMGDDQNERLKSGAFGAAAGTSLGGLAGLLADQKDLVVVGFVGSAVGGFLGWAYYAFLALLAGIWPESTLNRNFLAFQTKGLAGLRQQLDVQSIENLKAEFRDWSDKFARTLAEQRRLLLKHVGTGDNYWEEYAKGIMWGWLVSAADTVSFVFGTLAGKATQDPAVKTQGQSGDQACSQSRATIIIFGKDDKEQTTGKHWIHYSGPLKPHNVDQHFNEKSIGNKVRSEEYPSPYVTNFKLAGQDGEHRGPKNGEKHADDASNRPFVTLRLNGNAILAVDWPEGLDGNADYVVEARSLFYSVVTPALTEVLES